jgi:adenosine deaminase
VTAATPEHLRSLPKCELHCHVEGTVRPETVKELSTKNGVPFPVEDPENLYKFRDLNHFLEIFGLVCSSLVSGDDFRRIAYESLVDAWSSGVRYRETFFSPGFHIDRGVEIDTVYDGLTAGIGEANSDLGIRARLILDVDKPRGGDHALEMVRYAATKDRDVLVGVGGDSVERGIDHRQFVPALLEAGRAGLHRTFHAGEDGPAQNIRICVEEGGCERIDHGFRLLDDADLTAKIAAERIPLTVCPSSNVVIANVVPDVRSHPFARQREAGVLVMLNSDDPAMSRVDLGREYGIVAEAFGYDLETMEDLSLDSIEATFMDDAEKAATRASFVEEFDALRAEADLPPHAI